MELRPRIAIASSDSEVRAHYRNAIRAIGVPFEAIDPDLAVLAERQLEVLVIDLGDDRGMELLRGAAESRPDVQLLGIGYPPMPEQVEEATRLGIRRFLDPHDPAPQVVEAVADSLDSTGGRRAQYDALLERARERFRQSRISEAEAHARHAIAIDPERPEAFNLVGVAREAAQRRTEALQFYRIALVLDPTYELAKRNAETASKAPHQRGPAEFE